MVECVGFGHGYDRNLSTAPLASPTFPSCAEGADLVCLMIEEVRHCEATIVSKFGLQRFA